MTAREKDTFAERCYQLLRQVPCGCVTTYKDLAEALGTKAYRAVGNAMNRNPYAPAVPCHRVVMSNGLVGGFAHGKRRKIALLKAEGIEIKGERVADLAGRLYSFPPL